MNNEEKIIAAIEKLSGKIDVLTASVTKSEVKTEEHARSIETLFTMHKDCQNRECIKNQEFHLIKNKVTVTEFIFKAVVFLASGILLFQTVADRIK